MKPRSLALFALLTALVPVVPTSGQEAHLKIKKIVLYKHGIGYFERQGPVTGSVTVPLTFKTEQMKDVLKSLFAVDMGGGRIATVLYDSKDPVSRQLDEILFKVPEGSALTQFLKQLKGARVTVRIGNTAVEGAVLGIEPVQRQTEHAGVVTTTKIVLLRTDGAIQALDLLDAQDVTILDEAVKKDLARMMDIYAKARYADRKTVHLRAEGEGQREVRVGYILETPIWKTSYRLLLEDNKPPLLQGWAILENRTDEDWEGVELSFVAGSPQSFILDLYTSYYPRRPVVDMGAQAGDRAELARGDPAERKAKPGERRRNQDDAKQADTGSDTFAATAAPAAPAPSLGELLATSMAPVTRGVQVGDLFSYAAQGPVTIKQGQAALVPILLEKLEKGGRVLFFRADVSPHPSHAMLLENSTALTLEKGPVTVFQGATCLGEGMLPKTLKTGMREMVTYALETGVEVEPQTAHQSRPVTKGVLAGGILTLVQTQVAETTYKLRNKTGKAYSLWIEHQKAGGYTLVEPKKADEELPAHLRFTVALAASGEASFVVREELPQSVQVAILSQSTEQIRFYLEQPYLTAAARAFLTKVIAIMDEKTVLDRRLAEAQQERNRQAQDQQRTRENLNVLRDSPKERTLREQYLDKLTKIDERLSELERQTTEDQKKREEVQQRLQREVAAFRE
jgi:hypothetical protein